jgi:hypothetical protein
VNHDVHLQARCLSSQHASMSSCIVQVQQLGPDTAAPHQALHTRQHGHLVGRLCWRKHVWLLQQPSSQVLTSRPNAMTKWRPQDRGSRCRPAGKELGRLGCCQGYSSAGKWG